MVYFHASPDFFEMVACIKAVALCLQELFADGLPILVQDSSNFNTTSQAVGGRVAVSGILGTSTTAAREYRRDAQVRVRKAQDCAQMMPNSAALSLTSPQLPTSCKVRLVPK